ncbi:lipopolysaccharide biosynthesis protein [Serratia symbiotica str. 'Cinara cedri']|nr:lipopolysaccharide biosynthesis protein [Serratia symbiotica str. 'Cinara cedri']
MIKPAFLITIDTEGDNLWENHDRISTKNIRFLPRFQEMCEKYVLKPVYLSNYEVVLDPAYINFARDVISRSAGEVGMHLHAWNSPPLYPLTNNDWQHKPYLIEYPVDQIRAKVDYMTKLLEDVFQIKILSHRAGRWAFNEYYASLLLEYGYKIDCSVTPGVNWQGSLGDPQGGGGTDYRHFPSLAYFIELQDISKIGTSTLLEVPMSIQYKYSTLINTVKKGYNKLQGKQYLPSVNWLRPNRNNLYRMKKMVEISLAKGHDYLEFMLHSSEFMPGGSPTFKTEQDIEWLYHDLEQLFYWLQQRIVGMTLSEYYQRKRAQYQ